ncbi:MAG: dihydroorotate dehydrogenase electron transfer subunit [Bacteroidales bacterium]|jgi:dihydroorotate dehydrogenase electron transfer subunit|nr:dihydroorotate dehydrogenase electron transfer subunit [Bacteroidales bacterium]
MKYSIDFKVAEKRMLSDNFFRLALQSENPLPTINPGQFVQILPKHSNGLRLPISINDVVSDNIIYLLIRIVGSGTKMLADIEQGETVNMILPLGNGFPMLSADELRKGKRILMVGGGVGIAPFLHLAKEYAKCGITTDVLLGARTEKHILLEKELSQTANLHIATEDGSCGTKGLITAHEILKEHFDRIYCCGPLPMMKAVASVVADKSKCYVSLEERMACGVGACLCCVVKTADGHNRCTCTEGPVFGVDFLGW